MLAQGEGKTFTFPNYVLAYTYNLQQSSHYLWFGSFSQSHEMLGVWQWRDFFVCYLWNDYPQKRAINQLSPHQPPKKRTNLVLNHNHTCLSTYFLGKPPKSISAECVSLENTSITWNAHSSCLNVWGLLFTYKDHFLRWHFLDFFDKRWCFLIKGFRAVQNLWRIYFLS